MKVVSGRPWFTCRARGALTAAVLAAAVAPVASAATPPFVATLKTPHTQPRANRLWDITVTAKSHHGKPLKATAYYQFLFQGQVVSTQYPYPGTQGKGIRHSPWPFTGHFTDQLLFPARSVGVSLTLRVVVAAKGLGTVKLDHNIRVHT